MGLLSTPLSVVDAMHNLDTIFRLQCVPVLEQHICDTYYVAAYDSN